MLHRRNRFFGKNSDAKIGCVVSAGRRPWDTPTVAGLRRRRLQPARRKDPQYFKPDCGVSQGRNLACTARCSVNSRKVRSSRRFPPVPLRSDRHAPPTSRRATDIPKGAHSPRQTTGTVSYETIPVFFSAAYPARSGLERVDVQLELSLIHI